MHWLLSRTALWKRPFARGDTDSKHTNVAPADSPATVTFEGSPPKNDMLRFTHSNARIESRTPFKPPLPSGPVVKKPNAPKR